MCVFLHLSKVTVHKTNGTEYKLNNKWWKSIVDESTGKKWSDFTMTKGDMVKRTCEWMNKMKAKKIPVLKVRLDPAGENVKLEKRAGSADWQSLQPLDFEFTSRKTPQHNSLTPTHSEHVFHQQ